uniref:Uncharacterized protein n=1 Tax=Globodera rostochiensis TaxID=31243 RepID=A0A914HYS9_GLORO
MIHRFLSPLPSGPSDTTFVCCDPSSGNTSSVLSPLRCLPSYLVVCTQTTAKTNVRESPKIERKGKEGERGVGKGKDRPPPTTLTLHSFFACTAFGRNRKNPMNSDSQLQYICAHYGLKPIQNRY